MLFTTDRGTTYHDLPLHIVLRVVRFIPVTWTDRIAMRVAPNYLCAFLQSGECDCEEGWSADNTGTCVVHNCPSDFNCVNGGECYTGYDGSPACRCPPGFLGRDCSGTKYTGNATICKCTC